MTSHIAVMDHSSALASACGSPVCSRFHATRQRGRQNRACSRRGANTVPHCSQSRVSVITTHVTRNGTVLQAVSSRHAGWRGGCVAAGVAGEGYGRRVPDAIFAHPRLATVYDAFDGGRDDLAAYLDIACELGADRVLDVGCGTGCLAVLLAESGRTVVGVDPAEASLEVGKGKDGA